MGCTAAIVFTCFGASYGTAKAGVGIVASGVLRPDLIVRSMLTRFFFFAVPCYLLFLENWRKFSLIRRFWKDMITDPGSCRHYSRRHGWYHRHLRTRGVSPDLFWSDTDRSAVHWFYSTRCWSLCWSRWLGCWYVTSYFAPSFGPPAANLAVQVSLLALSVTLVSVVLLSNPNSSSE